MNRLIWWNSISFAASILIGGFALNAQDRELGLWMRTTEKIDLTRIINHSESYAEHEHFSLWPLSSELGMRADKGMPLRRIELRHFVEKLGGTKEEAFLTFFAAPEFFISSTFDFEKDIQFFVGYNELFLVTTKEFVELLLDNSCVLERYVQLIVWTQETEMLSVHPQAVFVKGRCRLVDRLRFDRYLEAVEQLGASIDENGIFTLPNRVGSWAYWWHLRQMILFFYLSGDHERIKDLKLAVEQSLIDNEKVSLISKVFDSWHERLRSTADEYVSLQGRVYFERRPGLVWLLRIAQTVQWNLVTLKCELITKTPNDWIVSIGRMDPIRIAIEGLCLDRDLPIPVLDVPNGPFKEWSIGPLTKSVRNRFVTIDPFPHHMSKNHRLLNIVD